MYNGTGYDKAVRKGFSKVYSAVSKHMFLQKHY